jgi:hypothetical protein
MRLIKYQDFEYKDKNKRTLFKVDVSVFQRGYFWDEGVFMYDLAQSIDLDNPKENQFVFLKAKVRIHLPLFDIPKYFPEIAERIKEIETRAERNLNLDMVWDLIFLCYLIEEIPQIEKVFYPDLALDEEMNFNEKFFIAELDRLEIEPFDSHCPPIISYAYHLAENYKNVDFVTRENAPWVFNFLEFILFTMREEILFVKVDFDYVVDMLKDEIVLDRILDFYNQPGSFMAIREVEEPTKKEDLLVFKTPDGKDLFFIVTDGD